MKNSLLFAGLCLVAVIGGYFVGAWIGYPGPIPNYATMLVEIAAILATVGFCVAKISPRLHPTRCPTVCGGSLVFAAALTLIDPFAHLTKPGTSPLLILVAAMLPIPLVFAIGSLMRYQEWFSVAGLLIFVFACYALVGGNLHVRDSGAGFFTSW